MSIRIERVDRIDARLGSFDWPFARERADDVAAHWQTKASLNPHLFDGRVLLSRHAEIVARGAQQVLAVECFEVAFSAFMAWRDFGFPDQPAGIRNVFAMGALQSPDGAFLLGEMGAHTANAGRVYFPAGTPDLGDVISTSVDLDGSVFRELEEETGLTIEDVVRAVSGWTIVFDGPRVACMKLLRTRAPIADVQARVASFLAGQSVPELARLVPVADDVAINPAIMPSFMVAFLRDAFARA